MTEREQFGNYFMFPISAIQFGKSPAEVTREEMRERIDEIIHYCIFEVARECCEEGSTEERSVKRALERFNLKSPSLNWRSLERDHQSIANRAGGDIKTKFGNRTLLDVRDNWIISPRLLCTALAINAIIGQRPAALVYKSQVAAMASGYSGPATMPPGTPTLTDQQIRWDQDTLRARGWFCSVPASGRVPARRWWWACGDDVEALTKFAKAQRAAKETKQKNKGISRGWSKAHI